ncbi:MAG TPA: hypothetical protein VLE91_02035 [Candidatus Saccharimonadales bacterium]|nr:hypothetical protein [Candidatus Saccharimonadales bacterium]
MSILGKVFSKNPQTNNNYLSLILTPDRILASIWTFEGDQVKTLGFGHKSYKDQDILIHQSAIAIDSAGEQAKVDITKTVFGLSEFFLEDGALSRQTAKTLKKLATELDLDPQAFVPISTGINHLLKVEESITPHTILLGIFDDFCEIHNVENGTITKSKSTQGPINIEKLRNLTKSLKEENKELPARIVVYGISESSDLAQKITQDEWPGTFVHAPKIDFLDDAELCRSASYAQAADVLGYEVQIQQAEQSEKETGQTEVPVPQKAPPQANELGFVEGEDILLTKIEPPKQPIQKDPDLENIAPINPKQEEFKTDAQDAQIPPQLKNHGPKKSLLSHLPISALSGLFNFDPTSKSGKKILIAVVVLVLLVVGVTFVLGQTIAKAQITIKVNGQKLEKSFSAKVTSGAAYDKNNAQIGGNIVSGNASGSQKAVATGSKKIGDSAKGPLTVYNWTNAEKDFTKGTGVISKNGVKFTLDGDVQVASRSASSPGQSTVNAVATEVGTGGNLDANQDFTFAQYDQLAYSATNPQAFTGGSERQATVVTQDDLDKLTKSLTDTLTQKAKDDLKNQANGQKIDDSATLVKVTKKQLDKNALDEAALVNLDMEIQVNVLTYSEDDLKKLISESYANEAADNLEIRPENVTFSDINIKRTGDQMQLGGKFQANLVPKINEDDLKGQIAGKSEKGARTAILAIPGVVDMEVKFSPNIPIFGAIPRNKKNITFKVETT